MDDEKVLEAELYLGGMAEDFIGGDLGQTLIGMAQQEIDDYHSLMEKEDDYKKLKQYQFEIAVRRQCFNWFNELIAKSQSAGQTLELAETDDD